MMTIKNTFKDFKFNDNIKKNLEHILPLTELKKYGIKYYISGSYPLALFFGLRDEKGLVSTAFYKDIDIYFEEETEYQKMLMFFNLKNFEQIAETENATTFISISENAVHQQIQLIKMTFVSPEELFNTFDIINCCIAIYPNEEEIISHTLFFKTMLKKELEFCNPKIANISEIETEETFFINLFISLERINKYCNRYNLTLSSRVFKILWFIYNKYPIYKFKTDTIIRTYSGFTDIIKSQKNIWTLIYKEITQSSYFDKDPNNYFKKSCLETYGSDSFSDPTEEILF